MKEETYLVYLKDQLGIRSIVSASAEICSEHSVLLGLSGDLIALFLLELMDHWTEATPCQSGVKPRSDIYLFA